MSGPENMQRICNPDRAGLEQPLTEGHIGHGKTKFDGAMIMLSAHGWMASRGRK